MRRPVGDVMLQDWQHVHNVVIPTHVLTLDDVRERALHYHLEVAYAGSTADSDLVGCSTVRPPTDDDEAVATVIARVLPAYRGRGYGEELYVRGLDLAWELGARTVETVVLASNTDGLRFAQKHGFGEVERYLLPDETIPWVTLRLG
ncbi:GNAT family N-acetyltransferase [Streptomyces sp. NPDC047886]|uniref:GNAT family N-acetyltransferase n=1 Tax=Streptomyces sp. NPDC047886 TaxID=3365490 RepID=UPI003721D78E